VLICSTAPKLLMLGSRLLMEAALAEFPEHRDDGFDAVHDRLAVGYATKLHLAALITWKHIQDAPG